MANLEIEGKVVKVLKVVTGESGNGAWEKQDFVIETEDRYPTKVCFSAWKKMVEMTKRLKEGDSVKVFFNAESREHNERYFTNLSVWKLEVKTGTQPSQPEQIKPAEAEVEGPDLPF